MDKEQFIQRVTAHLRSNGGLIAVTQESNKLFNPHAATQKYNWSYDHVVKEFGSVEQMLVELKNRGFSNGAKLSLRKKAGSTSRTINEVTLSFDSKEKTVESQREIKEETMNTAPTSQQQAQAMPALGMSYVPQDTIIGLKVKAERYDDLVTKNSKLEKENNKLESELRISKEDYRSLERKFETQNDRHELKIERLEADKKKFWESESGKQTIEAAMTALPQLAAAFSQKTAAVPALGAALSQDKQAFIEELKVYPDQGLPLLGSIVNFILTKPDFQERVIALIDEYQNV